MEEVEIVVPWPPSMNHYWRAFIKYIRIGKYRKAVPASGKGPAATAYAKAIVSVIQKRLKYVEPMFIGDVGMSIYLFPPTVAASDVDNFNKGILDGVTNAKLWTDDTLVKQLTVTMCEKVSMTTHPHLRAKGCAVIRIWDMPGFVKPTFDEVTNGVYTGPLF